jgi:hypothetical protein
MSGLFWVSLLKLSGLGPRGVRGAVCGTGDENMLEGRLTSDASSVGVFSRKSSSTSGLELLLVCTGVLLVFSSGGGVMSVLGLDLAFTTLGGRMQVGGVILRFTCVGLVLMSSLGLVG